MGPQIQAVSDKEAILNGEVTFGSIRFSAGHILAIEQLDPARILRSFAAGDQERADQAKQSWSLFHGQGIGNCMRLVVTPCVGVLGFGFHRVDGIASGNVKRIPVGAAEAKVGPAFGKQHAG